mmetsp:Transcript_54950/g.167000  ORF Transcript_54950/g.167000 Transcript_54950/m.167000 type:complete len:235 (-) Transcript_54950:283-987(-)
MSSTHWRAPDATSSLKHPSPRQARSCGCMANKASTTSTKSRDITCARRTSDAAFTFFRAMYARKPWVAMYSKRLQPPGLEEFQGYLRVAKAKRHTPSAKSSLKKLSCAPPRHCSGAAYKRFPLHSWPHRASEAMPKSMSLTAGSPDGSLRVIKMFSNDRSLWAMPKSCNRRTAPKTCCIKGRTRRRSRSPSTGSRGSHENKSPSVANSDTTYVFTVSLKTPKGRQMCSKPLSCK